MKRFRATLLICILSGVTVGAGAAIARGPQHAYREIAARNAFGLVEPPVENIPPPLPPPKITLTGITALCGNKRALLKWLEATKPGQAPKEQTCILTEGQRQDDVVVLEIDVQAGTVKVNNHGVVQTVSFAA